MPNTMADVFDAIKPTLMVSQCLALGPFSVDNDAKRLEVSWIGLTFSTLVLLAYSGNSGWVLYYLLFVDQNDTDKILEVNKKCQVACGVGVAVVTILLVIIQRKKILAVVNNIHQIDGEMRKLGIKVSYDQMIKHSGIFVVCLLILLIALTLHAAFVWNVETEQKTPTWISILVPPFFNFTMELQFIIGALMLKKHFSLLNDYLTTFNDKTKNHSVNEKDLLETYVDGHINETFLGPKLIDTGFIAWDGNLSRFRPRKEVFKETSDSQSQLANIKIFRKAHSSLCDVKESLNSAFSLQLLASVAQAFVIITSDLYLLFTTLSDTGLTKVAWLTYPVVWTITHVLELVFVVVTCTKTSKQANQTAVIVHKLLARDCNPDIRNQLKLFSIQLLHRKISFSACGFFTLDMTLLQAIIGAATTYLVILIQFHLGQPTAVQPTPSPTPKP